MATGPTSKIPPHLEPELYQKHLDGRSDGQIAVWLNEEHGVPATRLDVCRARGRYARRYAQGEVAGPAPVPKAPRWTPPPKEDPPEPLIGELVSAEEAPPSRRPALALVAPPPAASDEDLLRHWRDALSRGAYAAEQADDQPLKLAHLHVLTKLVETTRKLRKDRLDALRLGQGENQGPPVKGYLTVSPEDWPEAVEPKREVN